MNRRRDKNSWALFLLILAGIVLGGFLGLLAKDSSYFKWLNYGKNFGLTSPFELDLGIIYLSFKFTIDITIASILGIILAIFVYKKI